MAESKPLVSIGMPVYNAGELLHGSIQSLLAQDMADFELVICDNASTDSTADICREYAERDSRVRYHRNEQNLGALGNFDRVAELAEGRYFMWASHDDWWDPRFISACLQPFGKHDIVLAYPKTRIVEPDGDDWIIDHEDLQPTLGIASPTRRLATVLKSGHLWTLFFGLLRTDVVKRLLPIPRVHSSDTAFVAVLSLVGQFQHVPEVLFSFRAKPESGKYHRHAEFLGAGQEKTAKKYESFRPTAMAIFKRATKLEHLRLEQKASVLWQSFRWWLIEDNIISPSTRRRLTRLGRRLSATKVA